MFWSPREAFLVPRAGNVIYKPCLTTADKAFNCCFHCCYFMWGSLDCLDYFYYNYTHLGRNRNPETTETCCCCTCWQGVIVSQVSFAHKADLQYSCSRNTFCSPLSCPDTTDCRAVLCVDTKSGVSFSSPFLEGLFLTCVFLFVAECTILCNYPFNSKRVNSAPVQMKGCAVLWCFFRY